MSQDSDCTVMEITTNKRFRENGTLILGPFYVDFHTESNGWFRRMSVPHADALIFLIRQWSPRELQFNHASNEDVAELKARIEDAFDSPTPPTLSLVYSRSDAAYDDVVH